MEEEEAAAEGKNEVEEVEAAVGVEEVEVHFHRSDT